MINLLSNQDKKQIRAARRNIVWRRYIFLLLAVIVSVGLIAGSTWLLLTNQTNQYQQRVAANTQKQDAAYNKTKTEAENFRNNLKVAQTILSGETSYSYALVTIAKTLPPGCVLSSITLSPAAFGSPQALTFLCTSNDRVIALKTALENNSKAFSKVNIVSISTNASGANSGSYPVTAMMSMIIAKPVSTENVR